MIKIKFFAVLREEMKREEMLFEMPPGAVCGEILFSLKSRFPALAPILSRCLVAVNGSYAGLDAQISEGDELALLPPVSGG